MRRRKRIKALPERIQQHKRFSGLQRRGDMREADDVCVQGGASVGLSPRMVRRAAAARALVRAPATITVADSMHSGAGVEPPPKSSDANAASQSAALLSPSVPRSMMSLP